MTTAESPVWPFLAFWGGLFLWSIIETLRRSGK